MDAVDWNERYADAELVWSATPNQFVAGQLAELTPGRAVDLAAGEGRNALWLSSLGWQVTAVDFAQAGLDKGRAVEPPSDHPIEWVCADVLNWAAPVPVDLAVIAYLQLPAAGRQRAVRRAWCALDIGGTFLCVAHDSSNLTEGTGGPQDPSVLMTADDLLADLDGESFEVVRAERVSREVEPGHGGEPARTAYDCLVHLVKR
ncbi:MULTISPECIES: class I SAM-dependent methyltransferase [unclassified Nocardioides]|uniref:class I SAM-dependent methyltransferase n=1 Tax=unclassified Nocardioides TaxID=2615069 RepID=UPI0009E67512|nr:MULTISPECIES: class I SAM-dependent methyltransferase [unclassified Nocardioides]